MDESQKENLKKLVNASSPLMEKFRERAPGSYKHSQTVGNLCEAIALELNLDVDLMKAAGLLHDIGKMVEPQNFTENQNGGENPHNGYDPIISYQLITKHVADSVFYLIQNAVDIPIKLIEIISQHHGNSILSSIYNEAKKKANGNGPPDEDHFRYKSRKPQSTEAVILMIVDNISATARSLFSNGNLETPESRMKVINDAMNRLEQDEQIDELTYGVARVIKKVLYQELESEYHSRLTYEDKKEVLMVRTEEGLSTAK